MSLNWEWNDKMGECVMMGYNPETNDFTKECTCNIYKGNAYMIGIYEYEDNGSKMYSLSWFVSDKTHMMNILGLSKDHKGLDNFFGSDIKSIKLNTNYKNVPEIVSLLAKAKTNISIELYNEQ